MIKKGPMKVGLYGMWHKLGMCTYHKQHRGGKKKYKIIIKRKKKKVEEREEEEDGPSSLVFISRVTD